MSDTTTGSARARLEQIDGLRAVAALSVVAFHFTTRFDEVFVHTRPLEAGFAWGYLGVNLFFVISGFVIFMTIEAARSPADFAFSRFSRLFPTFWVAVVLTWLLTRALPVPGNVRSLGEMLANLTMVHDGFGVASVDGAYWSLEVELIYYLWMLAFGALGWLRRPRVLVLVWLAVALLAAAVNATGRFAVPHVLMHYGLLRWIPWFSLGMTAYLLYTGRGSTRFVAAGLAMALLAMLLQNGWLDAAVGAAAGLAVWLASRGRLAVVGWRPLVFVGAISYPLYLIHEQLGWLLMLELQRRGLTPWLTVGAALLVCLLAAWALHVVVEMPVMARLRGWWRARRPAAEALRPAHRSAAVFGFAALLALAVGSRALAKLQSHFHAPSLEQVNGWDSGERIACSGGNQHVLLILGQSNAASHAAPAGERVRIPVLHQGQCAIAADPLPGTSGRGSSLWTLVVPALDAARTGVSHVAAPLAVGATAIRQWTHAGPVREMLERHLASVASQPAPVDAVLWQQGEADMLRGTEAKHYLRDLKTLRKTLDDAGIRAPLFVAYSTRCSAAGTTGSGSIRRVLQRHEKELQSIGIWLGPDTDAIGSDGRSDGCHFNAKGRSEAAQSWTKLLLQRLPA